MSCPGLWGSLRSKCEALLTVSGGPVSRANQNEPGRRRSCWRLGLAALSGVQAARPVPRWEQSRMACGVRRSQRWVCLVAC